MATAVSPYNQTNNNLFVPTQISGTTNRRIFSMEMGFTEVSAKFTPLF